MTEKSTAKKQYESFEQTNNKIKQKLDKSLASFLLKLPIPMSYEVWKHLHKVKGDLE